MSTMIRTIVLSIMFGSFFVPLVVPAIAAEFPSKPVTVICPYGPGSGTDITLRVLADTMNKRKILPQPVIIENKPGASATLGPATMAATAKPDGYTIGALLMGIFYNPHMMKTTWDPLKDFTYILQLSDMTFGVVVKADAPWKTWQDFIAYSKANPGKVSFASPGKNATGGMIMDLIAIKEGITWKHVPQRGIAEDISAVLGGHVDASANATGWGPQIDSGQLRLLVTWGEKRYKKWPNVPNLKESGLDIVARSPWGLGGPKGMDPKVVKVLHDAFKKGMEQPEFNDILDKFNWELVYKSSESYTEYAKELNRVAKEIVDTLGLRKD
jgi:tripartite-type tricarboxylate transporter receptor subunit TctC